MKQINTSPKKLLQTAGRQIHKFGIVLFVIFIVGVYSFLTWRIVYYTGVEPDETTVNAQLKTAGVPRIDPEVIKKMEQLKDNSVNVQTLFDKARDNPFQED